MTATALCPLDGAVISAGVAYCRGCADQLALDIQSATDLLRELDVTLSRQDVVGAPTHGRRSNETPLPFHDGAGRARDELRASVRAMALAGSPTATEVRRFRAALTRAREVIDVADPRTFVGVCECEAWLYARRDEPEVTCGACGKVWDAVPPDAWEWLRHQAAPVAKLREWLLALGISRSRAQLFRVVARLEPVEGSAWPRAYRLGDVYYGVIDSAKRRQAA